MHDVQTHPPSWEPSSRYVAAKRLAPESAHVSPRRKCPLRSLLAGGHRRLGEEEDALPGDAHPDADQIRAVRRDQSAGGERSAHGSVGRLLGPARQVAVGGCHDTWDVRAGNGLTPLGRSADGDETTRDDRNIEDADATVNA